MNLQDLMVQDVEALLNTDEFAEVVIYNGSNLTVVFSQTADEEKGNTFASSGSSDRARVWMSAEAVTPASGDEFIRNGVTWRYARMLESAGGMHLAEFLAEEAAGWRR